jgi:hypothetical protein
MQSAYTVQLVLTGYTLIEITKINRIDEIFLGIILRVNDYMDAHDTSIKTIFRKRSPKLQIKNNRERWGPCTAY